MKQWGEMEPREFYRNFRPRPDVDYTWVLAYAKERYAEAQAAYHSLDSKAASIISTLGAGSGLLTFGVVAGLSANAIPPGAVIAGAPALLLAVLAAICSAISRSARRVYRPPNVNSAVQFAEYFTDEYKPLVSTEVGMIGAWHRAIESMDPITARKAWWVNASLYLSFAATIAIAIPVGYIVYMRM